MATVAVLLCAPCARAGPIIEFPAYEVSLFASDLGASTGIAVGPDGNLYLTDYAGFRVLRITASLTAGLHPYDVIASGIAFPSDVAFAFGGRMFVTSSVGPSGAVFEVTPGAAA